jgi:4-amino-4-deoxy-L-arabinose transferase-like glycosyltransferase
LARSHFRRFSPLYVILALYLLLAVLYSLKTPFFEKSDEVYHVAYIVHLADGKGFPPPDPHNPARQEATQPPLYYLLGAALITPIDTGDMDVLTRLNPYYRPVWDNVYGDNRNRYMHTVNEATPRRGAALAVRSLRCTSIVLGCVTVTCTYLIACALFPDRIWLAGGAAAFSAFNPRFLYVSGTVNNDVMVAATCALTGLAALRLIRGARPRARHAVLVGLALGAALLSKVSAVVMVPVVAVALCYAATKGRTRKAAWRSALTWLGIVLLCAAAVSGWWFVRNAILLDGDPTGAAVHVQKWGRRRRALAWDDVKLEIQGLEESYWAVFGLNSIPIERWINLILFGVNRLTVLGTVVLAARQWTRWRAEGETWVGLLAVGLWALGSLASVLYWMYLMKGVNLGRLLYPALPAIALLMVLAPNQFLPRRWQPFVTGALSLALLALAAACPFVYLHGNYAPPPLLDEAEVGPLTERLDADFQGQIKLLGYHVPQRETWPGDRLAITLYYEALVPFGIDYTVFVHFVAAPAGEARRGDILVQQDTYTGMGRYPTTMWRPGDIFADTFHLTMPEWTPVPGRGTFEVGFYNRDTDIRLLVVDEHGQVTGDSVWFHEIATVAPPGKE